MTQDYGRSETQGPVQDPTRERATTAPGVEDPNTAYPDTAFRGEAGTAMGRVAAGGLQLTASGGLTVLAGLWLALSPWALNYGDQPNAVFVQVIAGLSIAVLGLASAISTRLSELSPVTVILGIFIALVPLMLTFTTGAAESTDRIYWNAAITGTLVALTSGWSTVVAVRDRLAGAARSRRRGRRRR